jgi:hypothetical protein
MTAPMATAAENSRRPPLRPRAACRPIALSQALGAARSANGGLTAVGRDTCSPGRSGVRHRRHEPDHRRTGKWIFAPPLADCVLVNIGDQLQTWTGAGSSPLRIACEPITHLMLR